MTTRIFTLNLAAAAIGTLAALSASAADGSAHGAEALVARGRYIVAITGCNDCHTPGYAASGGTLPEADWLTGDTVGYQGPWGTSYPTNLRLSINRLTEDQWLALARAERLPPMPWFSLAHMTDEDLRAIYAFLRALGPKGEPAPLALPPGESAATPVFDFVPRPPAAAASHTTQPEQVSDVRR